jgi:hypothetical protein
MPARNNLTNREIAELPALESESVSMPAKKALRAASRRALMWPEEAADIYTTEPFVNGITESRSLHRETNSNRYCELLKSVGGILVFFPVNGVTAFLEC